MVLYTVEKAPGGWLVFRGTEPGQEILVRGGDVGAMHRTENGAKEQIAAERRTDRAAAKRLGVVLVTATTKGGK